MRRTRQRLAWTTLTVTSLLVASLTNFAADKPSYGKGADGKDVKIIPENWTKLSSAHLDAKQIDDLLNKDLQSDKLTPSPRTTDEQFIRRVNLDLIGKLPLPADVTEFVANKDADKREKLVDQLLNSDEFSHRWARYWHAVVVAHATDERIKRSGGTKALEDWLYEEFKAKKNWGDVARAVITASGTVGYDGTAEGNAGAAMFHLCHSGADAAVERAAETSRVFLGIQIQCAQCHDHPTDIWKRQQFHELTAFYARMRERLVMMDGRPRGIELVSLPRGEHQMPGKEDPKKTTLTHPKFLTGQEIAKGLPDEARRKALANFVTSKDNYWFSAAYANRIWAELMGQGFYQPVDNLGPLQQATYPDVLLALANNFRATNYDVRDLFRVICATDAYQRQTRIGESTDQHLHFAAAYPTRLPAGTLWDSLVNVLGPMQMGPRPMAPQGPMARFAGRFSLERQFKDAFDFDPSTKPDEIEGSIPQALMLMNNPQINSQIRAEGNTVLARILKSYPNDDDALRMLYLRTLARKPTDRETATAKAYLKEVGKRNEVFEDLLWALVNSTEFQTKK